MLYIPVMWWHCVEGSLESNMVVNWWFDMHQDKVEPRADGAKRAARDVRI